METYRNADPIGFTKIVKLVGDRLSAGFNQQKAAKEEVCTRMLVNISKLFGSYMSIMANYGYIYLRFMAVSSQPLGWSTLLPTEKGTKGNKKTK